VAPDLEAQVDEPPELFADLVARAVGAAGVLDVEESTEVGPGVRKADLRCLCANGFVPEMGKEEPRVAAHGQTRSGRGAEGQGEPLLAQGPGERAGIRLQTFACPFAIGCTRSRGADRRKGPQRMGGGPSGGGQCQDSQKLETPGRRAAIPQPRRSPLSGQAVARVAGNRTSEARLNVQAAHKIFGGLYNLSCQICKFLILRRKLVGTPRFELGTP
jgi:hypothetical protein